MTTQAIIIITILLYNINKCVKKNLLLSTQQIINRSLAMKNEAEKNENEILK